MNGAMKRSITQTNQFLGGKGRGVEETGGVCLDWKWRRIGGMGSRDDSYRYRSRDWSCGKKSRDGNDQSKSRDNKDRTKSRDLNYREKSREDNCRKKSRDTDSGMNYVIVTITN